MSGGSFIALGVNIDHVATLRQARGTRYPDPVYAALMAEQAGADSITLHLREDRRHIQDHDLTAIKAVIQTRMNLEMAATDEMLEIATRVRPEDICLVPERRNEVTTEGGLDVAGQLQRIREVCAIARAQGMRASLFIDPDPRQIEAARTGWGAGRSSCTPGAIRRSDRQRAARRSCIACATASRHAASLGLTVHAGHGLHYHNVQPVAAIPEIVELNIGHAIIARAVFHGLAQAVSEMKHLMIAARGG